MAQRYANDNAESIIDKHRRYAIEPYRAILEELLGHVGCLETLNSKTILELGPGNRVNLIRFLAEQIGADIRGAGRTPLWPWTPHREFIKRHIENTLLLGYLSKLESQSIDLIYSRHVMEQHSIHAGILLTSRTYWRYIRENSFTDQGPDYPSSTANIQAIFKQCYRILKPGGIIISQIGRRRFSALDRPFLDQLHPQKIVERPIGRMSCIITVIK